MYYSDEVLTDVRLGNDIVDVVSEYVKLKRSGANYFGLCPFHSEKTASFSVNPEKQIYYCFGCHKGGNVFKFIEEKENLTFPETVEYLARRIGYQLPEKQSDNEKRQLKEKLFEIHKLAARFYYDCLNADMGKATRIYLDKRGIEPNIRKKFGLGYSPADGRKLYDHLTESGFDNDTLLKSGLIREKDGRYYDNFRNRLMIPIIDIYGRIIAFGARKMRDEDFGGKYINSSDTEIFNKGYNLFNIKYARDAHKNELILVEGYMDVISMYQAGFKNVIAALGTAFTRNQAAAIKRSTNNVVVLFDSDEAGENAVLRALPILREAGVNARVFQVRDAKDPDEYIKSYGAQAFAKLFAEKTVNSTIFRIEHEKKKYSLDDTDQKLAFTSEAIKIIADIDNPVEQDVYIKYVSEQTGISQEALLKEVGRVQGRENAARETNGGINKNVKNVVVNNALDEAQSGLLSIVASDKSLYERVERIFDKKEFADELYMRLYEIIGNMHAQNRPVHEADVMTYLDGESGAVQSRAASIFMAQLPYENDEQRVKALSDDLKVIKNSYIKRLMEEASDEEFLQLQQQQKNVENIIKSL